MVKTKSQLPKGTLILVTWAQDNMRGYEPNIIILLAIKYSEEINLVKYIYDNH